MEDSMASTHERFDAYLAVTDQIVAALELLARPGARETSPGERVGDGLERANLL
jgi:hypothetical protein